MSSTSGAGAVGIVTLVLAGALAACRRQPALESAPPLADASVVDVGYAEQRRAEVTSAISSVSRERIDRLRANSMAELLQGLPGLYVTGSTRGMSVRVRGAQGEPLFVIDGTPVMAGSDIVAGIHPSQVERVDVLKDGAAMAVYGMRGANGVILISSRLRR